MTGDDSKTGRRPAGWTEFIAFLQGMADDDSPPFWIATAVPAGIVLSAIVWPFVSDVLTVLGGISESTMDTVQYYFARVLSLPYIASAVAGPLSIRYQRRNPEPGRWIPSVFYYLLGVPVLNFFVSGMYLFQWYRYNGV